MYRARLCYSHGSKHLSVGLAPMETVLASGKGKSCYLEVEGEQRLWDEFSILLGWEDADCLYMCMPDGGVQSATALKVTSPFLVGEKGVTPGQASETAAI